MSPCVLLLCASKSCFVNPGVSHITDRPSACEIYDASQKLPEVLRDPITGHSVSPSCTAMTKALGTDLTLWEWFEEQVPQPDGSLGPRPELERFALAMIGNGQAMSRALYHGASESCRRRSAY